MRTAQRNHTKVTETLKTALRRLVDAGRITVNSMRLIKAPPASGKEVEAELPDQVEAWLAKRETRDGTNPQGEVQVQTLERRRLPGRTRISDQQHPPGLRVEGQTQTTHAARDDERLLRGTERCEASSSGGIESACSTSTGRTHTLSARETRSR